jgi:antitoxin MazE
MKSRIVQIGNSRGIRLPKVLLEQAQLADEVELEAEPGRIVIRNGSRPRAGWAAAARRMRERDEDRLLDPPTPTQFDEKQWKWR